MRALAKQLLPPLIANLLRRYIQRHPNAMVVTAVRGKPQWEYSPDGEACWDALPGWNVSSIVEMQRQKWPTFLNALAGRGPLGVSHEAAEISATHYAAHNTLMSFAYVLARASHERRRLSLLDWGGGCGHYAVISRAIMPEVALHYTCKDVPLLCELGRELLPGDRFVDTDAEALAYCYDLIFVSSSLHYSRDVYATLKGLCDASQGWLMVTRQPVVETAEDFVVIQRPYAYGYETEYPGWFLNRGNFIAFVERQGFRLEREFLVDEKPEVYNAPEQCRYAGFLFRRI